MNFVFLGGFTYPAGMAGTKRVQGFITYLKKNNNDVSVVTMGNLGDLSEINNSSGYYDGIYYQNIGSTLPSSYVYYILLPLMWLIASLKLLKLKKSESNFLYVYNSFSIDNLGIIFLARFFGYKIIVDIVEDYSLHLEKVSFVLSVKIKTNIFLEKRIKYLCDGIVVISTYLENRFKKLSSGKIPVILIPITTDVQNNPVKSSFSSPIIFSYSGSFGHKDGLPVFLEAFKKVLEIHNNCILYLSGKGNNPEQYITNETKDKIIYMGYISNEEYTELINKSDILCMTRVDSNYANAGFPFKLGEYLSTGNPVICTDISDVKMYLENYKDAIIIKPGSVSELVEAIEYLIANPVNAFELGKNGVKKCQKYFNPETNGKKLYDFAITL